MDIETFRLKTFIKETSLREYALFVEVMKIINSNSDLEKEMLISSDCSDGEELDEQLETYSILCGNIDIAMHIYKKFMIQYFKKNKLKKIENYNKVILWLRKLQDISINFLLQYEQFLFSIHKSFYKKSDGKKMLMYHKLIKRLVEKLVKRNKN